MSAAIEGGTIIEDYHESTFDSSPELEEEEVFSKEATGAEEDRLGSDFAKADSATSPAAL